MMMNRMLSWSKEHGDKLEMCLKESNLKWDRGVTLDEVDGAIGECKRAHRSRLS